MDEEGERRKGQKIRTGNGNRLAGRETEREMKGKRRVRRSSLAILENIS